MHPDATTDWRVLTRAVRDGVGTGLAGGRDGGGVDLAGGRIDWERVLGRARAHGVTPLLARGLADRDDVPASISDRLHEQLRTRAARNLGLADDLAAIATDLDAAGIRYLPFKGPVLAQAAYGDVSRRVFADLDLLVPRSEIGAAVDRLEAAGFRLVSPRPRKDDATLLGGPLTPPLVHEYTLHRDCTELEVRCQVGYSGNPFFASVPDLLDRAGRVEVGGRAVPALSPADRLLVLAFHGTKHRWHLLKWVADVAAAVSASDPAWADVLAKARAGGLERRLLLAASLAGRVLDSPIPDAVRRGLTARNVGPLVDTAVEGLREGPSPRPGWLDGARFNWRALDSRRARLEMAVHLSPLHPSLPEYRLLALPGWLHPVYYLIRPFRLAASRGRRLLGGG